MWPLQFRKLAIEEWIKNDKSSVKALRSLRIITGLPLRQLPSKQLIHYWGTRCWNSKFAVDGNMASVRHAKKKTVRVEANIEAVYETVMHCRSDLRSSSVRKLASEVLVRHSVEMSGSSVHKILHHDLGMKPYKVRKTQTLKQHDYNHRFQRASEFIGMGYSEEDAELTLLIFSDEARFTLDGYVSSKNVYWWADDSNCLPKDLRVSQKDAFSPGVMIWVAINFEFGLSPPYFFPGSVNSRSYMKCLLDFFIPFLQDNGYDPRELIFQQDGARCHTTDWVLNQLREQFFDIIGNRSQNGTLSTWPPRSPDLAPNDFWLWGRLVPLVYPPASPRPRTLDELKLRITESLQSLQLEEVRHVLGRWHNRLELCISACGRHFELFKS